MLIHTDNLRRFPDLIPYSHSFDPEFYIPRVKHVYELDLYTFDGRNDRPNYINHSVIRKVRKELIKGLELHVLKRADFATTFWVSTTRVVNSMATDPIYITSNEDLEDWLDFDGIACSLEERFELENIQEEGGFLREVDVRIWREATRRVRPWLHVENCHFWFPVPHHEWYMWDNQLGLSLPDPDSDWDGKIKISREEFECAGGRDMIAFGEDLHAEAELSYLIEKLIARCLGDEYLGLVSMTSLEFKVHSTFGEKSKLKKAVPVESKDWVREKINRGRTTRKPRYQD
ncbi:hypothetical protein CMK12_15810 [Candidatus Poribacteria bacterium]|nr:hypothetical protein [Candidatus Poribacteria bacterium]